MKRKSILSLVAVIFLISAVFAVYLFDFLSKQAIEKPFHLSFALMPDQEQFTNETWRIVVTNEATDVLLNVDIFTSYGNQTIHVKQFDDFRDQYYYFDVQQIVGEDMVVDIYWQGGHQNFFCRNQDAVTE